MKKKTPELVILVGLPGSGKSTISASEEFKDYVVVSSDTIRKELFGDESIQGNPKEIFSLVQKKAAEELYKGNSVIYDATNVQPWQRTSALRTIGQNYSEISGKTPDYKTHCIDVDTPKEVCRVFDSGRTRHVPDYVFDRYEKQRKPVTEREGFDVTEVWHIPIKKDRIQEQSLDYKCRLTHALIPTAFTEDLKTVIESAYEDIEKKGTVTTKEQAETLLKGTAVLENGTRTDIVINDSTYLYLNGIAEPEKQKGEEPEDRTPNDRRQNIAQNFER